MLKFWISENRPSRTQRCPTDANYNESQYRPNMKSSQNIHFGPVKIVSPSVNILSLKQFGVRWAKTKYFWNECALLAWWQGTLKECYLDSTRMILHVWCTIVWFTCQDIKGMPKISFNSLQMCLYQQASEAHSFRKTFLFFLVLLKNKNMKYAYSYLQFSSVEMPPEHSHKHK